MFINILISSTALYCIVILYSYVYRRYKIPKLLAKTLEEVSRWHDEETGAHIKRVRKYSVFLAKKYKCPPKKIKEIYFFASLHDIGKIGVPFDILKKEKNLEANELKKVKNHSLIGFHIIKKLRIGLAAENIVKYHHEKWNGKGYPEGLKGKAIPLEARIVAIADVYDALRQERSYKPSFSHQKAVEIISLNKGVDFDPQLVEIFLENNLEFKHIFDMQNDGI